MEVTKRRHRKYFMVVAPMTALLAFTLQPGGPPPPAERSLQCEATLTPDSVRIQSEPLTIGYALPDSLGMVTGVVADEDSGIGVGEIDVEGHTVALETASAQTGSWTLTFTGDSSRTCAGTLRVLGIDGSLTSR
jgi:hypothetical protein